MLLATLDLSAGVLTYTAATGETNDLAIDVVNMGGTNYLRIRDNGPGVTITPSGSDLVADSASNVRAPLTSVTSLAVLTEDMDDTIALTLENVLPASIAIDAGDATTADHLTLFGTPGDDAIGIEPRRNADGIKGLRVTHATTTALIVNAETLTVDISQSGQDNLSIDRYSTGDNRPASIHVIGGGGGADTLSVTAQGDLPQKVDLAEGSIQIQDVPAGSELFLGRSDNIAIDQPKVAVEVIDTDANGNPVSLGPEVFNTLLLDTGASGILFTADPTGELLDNGYQTYSIPYDEQGVAGFTPMDVSIPYRVDFAGDSGERNTLNNIQVESSTTLNFSFFGPWGLVGMPAMRDRVTTIDMSKWLDPLNQPDLSIGVDFSNDVPADSGHFYHVPLQLVDFPASGQRPGGPVPTFAPLPEIPVKVRDDGHEVDGHFLVDTGAQLSIISSQMAFALGLDKNGNGSFDDEAVDFIDVGGIGGTITIPLVPVDRLSVPTQEGSDMVWTDLLVGIEDIEVENGPTLSGVFGMDFLTSGWAAKILPLLLGTPGSDEDGYFSHITFDFRNAANDQGTMIFDVVPAHDVSTTPAPSTLSVQYTGLSAVNVTTGDGNDLYTVDPSTNVHYTLDGGAHTTGDTLNVVVPGGHTASNNGTTIQISGYQNIDYTRFESVNIPIDSDHTPPTVSIPAVTPDPHPTPLDTVSIQFSEPVQGFDLADLSLTRDSLNVPLTGATLTTSNSTSFTLGNLSGLTNLDGSYVLTLKAAGSGITDLAGNPLATDGSLVWREQINLIVTSLEPEADGFVVRFNRPFDASVLNLYDSQLVPLGPADVTLVGQNTGPVAGSLVVDPSHTAFRFVKTGGVLADDTYTVTLRSASNGFKNLSGGLLDGDANGSTGDDYTDSFPVAEGSGVVVVGLPDFARGPGQAIHLPAAASTGIPLTISDGRGVTSLIVTVQHDPALLTILGATLAPGVPGSLTQTGSTADSATFLYRTTTPLSAGPQTVFYLNASVPETALYASKDLLTLSGVSVNAGGIASIGDSGLHLVAYPGDTDGSGDYGSFDAALIARVGVFLDRGFAAYQLADPTIVGDVDGSGDLGSFDAALVARKGVFLPVPQIPDLPPITPRFGGGPDPKISLPTGLFARPGQTLLVPVNLEQTDRGAIMLHSSELAIGLDPSQFQVMGVRAGSLAIGDILSWSFDQTTGLLLISTAGLNPITLSPGSRGTVVMLELKVLDNARGGTSALNLLEMGRVPAGHLKTRLNEGGLTLIPAPTDGAWDSVDGSVFVAAASRPGGLPIATLPAIDRAIDALSVGTAGSASSGPANTVAPPDPGPPLFARAGALTYAAQSLLTENDLLERKGGSIAIRPTSALPKRVWVWGIGNGR